jgi:hypothetical protein
VARIEAVATDMWAPDIASVLEHVSGGDGAARLRLRAAGEETLPPVAKVGGAESAIADHRNGAHAETAAEEHPDLPAPPDHQRGQRIVNSKVQCAKCTARGFRNKRNSQTAIYFHCGGRDMAPSCHCKDGSAHISLHHTEHGATWGW